MTQNHAFMLLHTARDPDDEDEKGLGFYTSEETANLAIEYYKGVLGFSSYPEGFEIFPIPVSGETDFDTVYVLWDMTDDSYDRSTTWTEFFLGAYSDPDDAEAHKQRIERTTQNRELVIDRCQLNKMEWLEGFSLE